MFRLFKVVQIILVRMQLAKRNIMMDGCDDENRHALKGIQNGSYMGPCIDYVKKKENTVLTSILRVSWVICFSQLDSK